MGTETTAVQPWAAGYFLVCFLVVVLCYVMGNKKYKPMAEALDKDEFSMRDFFPAGFYLMEKTRYQYNSSVDRVLRKYMKELYDPKYCEFYIRAYWGAAASYLLAGMFISGLLMLGGQTGIGFLMLGAGVLLGYMTLTNVSEKIEKRHLLISLDMPDLTNKIVILSGAGMTLRAAIVKISTEMSNGRPLYQELERAVGMMEAGQTPEAAFDYFVTKCNMPEIRRFVSVILQNMHRGGQDVTRALKEIGEEQWNNRKNAAKQFAEEASTKMLFPMMLMLLAVIMLTIAPAVMSMNI